MTTRRPLRQVRSFTLAILLAAGFTGHGRAAEILINGDFETGDLTGWQEYIEDVGEGGYYVGTAELTPLTGLPTPGPADGDYYAISDQQGPSAQALIQTFTVAPGSSATLRFDMFVNTYAPVAMFGGLDFTSGGTFAPNQYARVDLLRGAASV